MKAKFLRVIKLVIIRLDNVTDNLKLDWLCKWLLGKLVDRCRWALRRMQLIYQNISTSRIITEVYLNSFYQIIKTFNANYNTLIFTSLLMCASNTQWDKWLAQSNAKKYDGVYKVSLSSENHSLSGLEIYIHQTVSHISQYLLLYTGTLYVYDCL